MKKIHKSRLKLSNDECLWLIAKENLISRKFNEKTYLGNVSSLLEFKNKLSPDGRKVRWAVFEIKSMCECDYLGTGWTAREALINAGLEGWVKDRETVKAALIKK